ncbi:hypothetical protein LCGC14_2902650 [marine sediment metagenome]|uniref:Uncharacterized protein n=1 Tax=marine sediment metagenome TaxID=412755 RepID=A0A0F9AK27_9ZZZZ
MGRIVDAEGNKIEAEEFDEYTQITLKAVETLRNLVTEMIKDLDLTFFQTLGAVTSLQAQMVSTLMQRERLQTSKEEKDETKQ